MPVVLERGEVRRVAPGGLGFREKLHLKNCGDLLRDVVLDGEYVRHLPVVAFGPEVASIGRGDQLRGYPHARP